MEVTEKAVLFMLFMNFIHVYSFIHAVLFMLVMIGQIACYFIVFKHLVKILK